MLIIPTNFGALGRVSKTRENYTEQMMVTIRLEKLRKKTLHERDRILRNASDK